MTSVVRLMLLSGLALMVVGAMPTPQASAQDLSGQWTGYWHSDTNNHRGRLAATFSQTSPYQVEARFRGSFAKVLPFRYRAKLDVIHQEPGLTILCGSKKLGPLMGEFRYYAEITDCQFNATYSSRRNRGTWVMSR